MFNTLNLTKFDAPTVHQPWLILFCFDPNMLAFWEYIVSHMFTNVDRMFYGVNGVLLCCWRWTCCIIWTYWSFTKQLSDQNQTSINRFWKPNLEIDSWGKTKRVLCMFRNKSRVGFGTRRLNRRPKMIFESESRRKMLDLLTDTCLFLFAVVGGGGNQKQTGNRAEHLSPKMNKQTGCFLLSEAKCPESSANPKSPMSEIRNKPLQK